MYDGVDREVSDEIAGVHNSAVSVLRFLTVMSSASTTRLESWALFDRSANDLMGERIHDRAAIGLSFPPRRLRDFRNPELVGQGVAKLALHQIAIVRTPGWLQPRTALSSAASPADPAQPLSQVTGSLGTSDWLTTRVGRLARFRGHDVHGIRPGTMHPIYTQCPAASSSAAVFTTNAPTSTAPTVSVPGSAWAGSWLTVSVSNTCVAGTSVGYDV